jgi:hypothetical protein
MFMYRLAKDLGQTVEQILEMTDAEFRGWIVFYKWEAEEMKKASKR